MRLDVPHLLRAKSASLRGMFSNHCLQQSYPRTVSEIKSDNIYSNTCVNNNLSTTKTQKKDAQHKLHNLPMFMQRLHYTPGYAFFFLSSSYISKAGNKTSLKIGSYKSTCTISLLAAFPRCRLEDGGTKRTTKQQQKNGRSHTIHTLLL